MGSLVVVDDFDEFHAFSSPWIKLAQVSDLFWPLRVREKACIKQNQGSFNMPKS